MNSSVLPRDILAVTLECAVLLSVSDALCGQFILSLSCSLPLPFRRSIVSPLRLSRVTPVGLFAPVCRTVSECPPKTGKSYSLALNVWTRRNLPLIVALINFEGGDFFCMEQQLNVCIVASPLGSMCSSTMLHCIRFTPGHTQI